MLGEGFRPVNVLNLGQHQLQATKQDDPGRLREGAGVAWVLVEAVALHNGPAGAPVPGQIAICASVRKSLSLLTKKATQDRRFSVYIVEP